METDGRPPYIETSYVSPLIPLIWFDWRMIGRCLRVTRSVEIPTTYVNERHTRTGIKIYVSG